MILDNRDVVNLIVAKLKSVCTKIATMAGNLSTLSTTVSGQTTDIGNLQTTVSGQTTDIGNLQTTVSGHTTDIGNLQTTVSGQTTDIGNLQTTVAGHTTSIGTLNDECFYKAGTYTPSYIARIAIGASDGAQLAVIIETPKSMKNVTIKSNTLAVASVVKWDGTSVTGATKHSVTKSDDHTIVVVINKTGLVAYGLYYVYLSGNIVFQ